MARCWRKSGCIQQLKAQRKYKKAFLVFYYFRSSVCVLILEDVRLVKQDQGAQIINYRMKQTIFGLISTYFGESDAIIWTQTCLKICSDAIQFLILCYQPFKTLLKMFQEKVFSNCCKFSDNRACELKKATNPRKSSLQQDLTKSGVKTEFCKVVHK